MKKDAYDSKATAAWPAWQEAGRGQQSSMLDHSELTFYTVRAAASLM